MTNSFTPSSPRYRLDSFFTRHVSSEHSDTKMSFFRQINFVGDLSLSQQHTLARSGNRCFPPCFTTDINGHEMVLDVKPWIKSSNFIKQISCDAKSICFNPFTRRYNSYRWGGGMVVPNCLHGRWDSAHLGEVYIPFHTSEGSFVNNWLSLVRPYEV